MPTASRLISRRDLEFLLYEWLHVESLSERERFREHDRESLDGVLDIAEELATEQFAPINRLLDEHEPTVGADGTVVLPSELKAALEAYAASGLGAATFDEQYGGGQLPYVIHAASSMYLQAGSVGVIAYPFLSQANANLLTQHGTPEQIEQFALPVIEGRWFGTMALSEPHAGSSLGDITTMATPDAAAGAGGGSGSSTGGGAYRLKGSKMWISGGDHELRENIVHLVLARTPDAPAGPKGISLFIVPKVLVSPGGTLGERNDVALVGLNHKMGFRGTTNALLAFGEGSFTPGGQPGAVGYLVGQVGAGLAIMFDMMNEARIGVGSGAVSLGYTGYLHSLDYARTRPQGRSLVSRDPTSPPVMIVEHPDVRRMLLAQKSYVEGGLALTLFCARLVDEVRTAPSSEERAAADQLLGLLTPIAKSWPAQWGLTANALAIQVLGGAGYTRDFPVEQFYRDNRLNAIHEGTHGIQGIDLVGRKILRDGGVALAALAGRMCATVVAASGAGGEPAAHGAALATQLEAVQRVVTKLLTDADPTPALANATAALEALGHLVVAWLWLEQEVVAAGKTGVFYDGKRAAAAYFFGQELPKVPAMLDIVERGDRLTLDLDPDVL
ncbi:MAG TPA: acyl-CoA dehydrogenase [Pseudolysinimonas sp.]|jgi:alkylation response protein AidB-like acyl-CoA dehydrogenase